MNDFNAYKKSGSERNVRNKNHREKINEKRSQSTREVSVSVNKAKTSALVFNIMPSEGLNQRWIAASRVNFH